MRRFLHQRICTATSSAEKLGQVGGGAIRSWLDRRCEECHMWRQRIDGTALRTRATFVIESQCDEISVGEIASPSSAQRSWQTYWWRDQEQARSTAQGVLQVAPAHQWHSPSHVCHLRCRSLNITRSTSVSSRRNLQRRQAGTGWRKRDQKKSRWTARRAPNEGPAPRGSRWLRDRVAWTAV